MNDTADRLLAEVRARFQEAGLDDPAQEARILVSGLLGLSATRFLVEGGRPVAGDDARRVRAAIARRLAHEPVHRIIGEREFYGLMLSLSAQTLEPRPDTETLVECMLPYVAAAIERAGSCRVVDLGTGTGAICLALLSVFPEATGLGVDIAEGAVATAQKNASRNGLAGRFTAIQSNWFENISGRFDVIVSNPPYIASTVVDELGPEVKDHDPRIALDGGADGLDAYREIAKHMRGIMQIGAIAGLEIGFDQKHAVTGVFEEAGFSLLRHVNDLGGRDRVLVFG